MTPLSESLPLFPTCICGNYECEIPYGTCHCGCGKTTRLAIKTNKKKQSIKGFPYKYLFNHHKKFKPLLINDKPFIMDGHPCRHIPLTQWKVAIVDDSDYAWLMQWKWSARRHKKSPEFYATRNDTTPTGKRYILSMHRAICGVGLGDGGEVDHKNHDTLDNRRCNLRYVEKNQNQWNANIRKDNTSGYKGVSWQARNNKWRVQICVFGKVMHVGLFTNLTDAHQAYCDASYFYFGEFAKVS